MPRCWYRCCAVPSAIRVEWRGVDDGDPLGELKAMAGRPRV